MISVEDIDYFDNFLDDTQGISNFIQESEKIIQILYVRESDAIIAASIFSRVFYDLQRPCVMSEYNEENGFDFSLNQKTLPLLIGIEPELIVEMSINREHITITKRMYKEIKDRSLYLEKYIQAEKEEMSLSALAYFICSPMAPNLENIIILPLVSFHTFKPMEDYQGIHKLIANDAITGEIIEITKQLSFLGSNIYKVSESLIHTLNPFLPGIAGDENKAIELLTKSGIEDEVKGKKRALTDLTKDEIRDLNSNLILQLASHKGYQEEDLKFIKSKTEILVEDGDTILNNTWDYAQLVLDMIYRDSIPQLIAILLGERKSHLRFGTRIFDEERKAVGVAYRLIQDNQEEIIELSYLRYFMGDYKISWYNSSSTAAMALSHGLTSPDYPFAIVAPGPGDLETIGIRASKSHGMENLTSMISEVLKNREINTIVSGTALRSQFSLKKEKVETILLDINEKLKEFLS